MNSIILTLGSDDFPRIRVGIGRPGSAGQSVGDDAVVSHVLSGFSPEEEKVIKPAFAAVSEAIDCFLCEGIEAAMSKFN